MNNGVCKLYDRDENVWHLLWSVRNYEKKH